MDPLTIAAIVGGGVNLVKGLFGAIQSAKAQKKTNRLLDNPVTYKRPEEYARELAMREQQAAQSQPTWMRQAKENIGQGFATGVGNLKESAISSNTLSGGIGDLYQKQIQAYQDLGMQAQKWQETQRENLAGTLRQGAGYSDTEYQENVLRPWETQMNMAMGNKQAGATNLFSGLEGMSSTFANFAGTKYFQDIMKKLQNTGVS